MGDFKFPLKTKVLNKVFKPKLRQNTF